jgi:hypothetical protein
VNRAIVCSVKRKTAPRGGVFFILAITAAETAIRCVMGCFVPGVAYVVNRVLAVMYDR